MYQWTLLSRHPEYADQVAGWIFNQWVVDQDPEGYQKVLTKVLACTDPEPTPFMVLLLNGNNLIGIAEVKTHETSEDNDPRFWLDGVYVLPEYRGQGLAGQLVRQALLQAKTVGVRKLYLRTLHLDGGLYALAGFKPIEQGMFRGQPMLEMVAEIF
ncbi:GNAT family N-acetyltransferase [Saccharospirillum sp. HFRX-1]|uniref:GNAT family N-acetyltransferase n=1 Tax=unclassified Saccharospirillum TaxID=2633430 RepID=UPI00370FFA8B